MDTEPQETSLKSRTARTLKWNLIDRVASQLLYAVTGVILALLLSPADFGLVGAVLVFQAFASLLVDSGFASALVQRKQPTQRDYSTILWFNIGTATILYIVLYLAAPLIADCFQSDRRLVGLSRVMFLTLILNASTIIQVNRLVKMMNVKMVAVSNSLGLLAGGITGITLALGGYGAWAVVWQSIALAAVKALVLWTSQRWRPSAVFSFGVLRSYFGIGSKMMLTSFLNTLFLNIYSFFIGNRAGMAPLGYYTQSDKWSKMGIMSLYQVLTSTFLPTLSHVQDDPARFARVAGKLGRLTAYITFPACLWLAVIATTAFHTVFGTKWDNSILLFRLMMLRGIFTVLIGYYNNVLLAVGHARTILHMEILRDAVALAALAATLPYLAMTTPGNPVWGLTLLLYGQLGASALTWAVTLAVTARLSRRSIRRYLGDMAPYAAAAAGVGIVMWWEGLVIGPAPVALGMQCVTGVVMYIGAMWLAGSKVQNDAYAYLRGKQ